MIKIFGLKENKLCGKKIDLRINMGDILLL